MKYYYIKTISASIIALFTFFTLQAQTIYVSTSGNDANAGTVASPVLSFAKAQEFARAQSSVEVVFADGTYYLPNMITFTSADNKVTYRAQNEGKAIISGGSLLSLTWQLYKNGIYVADVSGNPVIDQLYINGVRQRMARFPNAVTGKNVYDAWDLSNPAYSAAMDALTASRITTWKNPTGGYIHAMHSALWGDMHWLITGKSNESTLTSVGGWQNNRPSAMHGNFRFVENIFEELDAPGEWFFDTTSQKLYFMPAQGIDLSTAKVEIVRLETLINYEGNKTSAVKNVNLKGFVFRHAARSFMENKEPLLRSDWTICRAGAVSFNGAVNCVVADCEFDQVGGNTVVVSNYNRGITITGCYIHNSGASGVVFVGDPGSVRNPLFGYVSQNYGMLDLTPGPKSDNYPDSCLVSNCLITLTGRDEKQTAGVQISMSHEIIVNHCSIYDVPRAGVNVNEGTFGGHVIENCDIFNTVLETGDHGSFNSWGRDRYWTPNTNATIPYTTSNPKLPFLDMLDSIVIRNNRFRCDHGWDIDLDDGSTWYRIYNNVLLNGGLKMREGYGRIAYNNVIVNNSLNPHVWYSNSQDIFKNNIVTTSYKPAAMTTSITDNGKWGNQVDYNFFATSVADMKAFYVNNCDAHSLNGYPQFVDSVKGNYQVKSSSNALLIGFKNFPMDQFGVVKPSLKAIAKTPIMPNLEISISSIAQTLEYKCYWLNILLKEPTVQEMSAHGVGFDEGGIALSTVIAGSTAANYGFQSSDLIQGINSTTIKTIADFRTYIDAHTIDTKPQAFSIVRNQVRITITINAPFTKTVVVNPSFSIPGRIGGAQFSNQFGVQTETCSDIGGGQNVGYIHVGDWMEYPIDVEKDTIFSATFRCACESTGGTMSILVDGTQVATMKFKSTGGWQIYADNKKDIALKAGAHTLKLLMTSAGYNLNWFKFDKVINAQTSIKQTVLSPFNYSIVMAN